MESRIGYSNTLDFFSALVFLSFEVGTTLSTPVGGEKRLEKPMNQQILLSVALITRNRPGSLERTLGSLRSQSVQPFEVVVSDDSDEEFVSETESIAYKFNCRYIRGPRQKCLTAVHSDSNAIWTTGEIGFVRGERVGTLETASQLDAAGVGQAVDQLDNNWGISDGSTIYPREIFDRGLRMVEDFGFGSSYLEFGAFLYKRGWKSRCVRGAFVEHHAEKLSKADPLSQRFASICFNCHFRPNALRMARNLAPHWKSWPQLPQLFEKAYRRWKTQ
jgi:glycosyltransferase involved in cell wall biosynthesis